MTIAQLPYITSSRSFPPSMAKEQKKSRQNFVVTEIDNDILLALYKMHYLTVEQLTTYLSWSPKAMSRTRSKLKRLFDMKLLHKQVLPRRELGSLPFVYSLAARGIRMLQSQGLEVVTKRTPKEDILSWMYLHHTLRLNDVIIAAHLDAKKVAGVKLMEMRHERIMKHYPTQVTYTDKNGKEKHGSVVPDCWFCFQLEPPFSAEDTLGICFELDRDTEDQWPFRSKIRRYVAFMGPPGNSPYEKAFGCKYITVAFLASEGGSRRAIQMKQWVDSELKEAGLERYAPLFLFSYLAPGPIDPVKLFHAPLWQTITSETPTALIAKV